MIIKNNHQLDNAFIPSCLKKCWESHWFGMLQVFPNSFSFQNPMGFYTITGQCLHFNSRTTSVSFGWMNFNKVHCGRALVSQRHLIRNKNCLVNSSAYGELGQAVNPKPKSLVPGTSTSWDVQSQGWSQTLPGFPVPEKAVKPTNWREKCLQPNQSPGKACFGPGLTIAIPALHNPPGRPPRLQLTVVHQVFLPVCARGFSPQLRGQQHESLPVPRRSRGLWNGPGELVTSGVNRRVFLFLMKPYNLLPLILNTLP